MYVWCVKMASKPYTKTALYLFSYRQSKMQKTEACFLKISATQHAFTISCPVIDTVTWTEPNRQSMQGHKNKAVVQV